MSDRVDASASLTAGGSRWTVPADEYDAWFDSPWGRHATAIEHEALLDALGPIAGRLVLDAGCGTGRFTHRLEAARADVVAIDRDASALTIAGRHAASPRMVADLHALPMSDACVDAACAVTVCEFTTAPAAVIAELVRVTRPGGRVVIGSLNPRSPWGWWNRSQLSGSPWTTARFLDPATLHTLGSRHGHVELHASLYSPRSLPLQRRWGPAVEAVGRRLAPNLGAFQVLVVHVPTESK